MTKWIKYYLQGRTNFKKGNFYRAVTFFSKAIRIKPGDYHSMYWRANAYNQGVLDQTVTVCYKLFNESPYVYDKGNLFKAQADLTEAIRLKPDFYEALFARGTAFLLEGNLEKAFSCYTKALSIKPDYDKALYGRGLLFLIISNFEQAIADFDTLLLLSPYDNDLVKNFSLIIEDVRQMQKGQFEDEFEKKEGKNDDEFA
jgi:tetratricopeptide (TPR) repeat protein